MSLEGWGLKLSAVAGLALLAWISYAPVREAAKKRRRSLQGLCVECGYDLRASTGKCPECGREK